MESENRDIQMGICLCAGSKRGVHLNKTERSSLPCFVSSSLRCLNALAARPEFFRLGNQQPIALTDWGEAGLGRAVWGGKTAAFGRSVRSLVVAVAVPAAHPRVEEGRVDVIPSNASPVTRDAFTRASRVERVNVRVYEGHDEPTRNPARHARSCSPHTEGFERGSRRLCGSAGAVSCRYKVNMEFGTPQEMPHPVRPDRSPNRSTHPIPGHVGSANPKGGTVAVARARNVCTRAVRPPRLVIRSHSRPGDSDSWQTRGRARTTYQLCRSAPRAYCWTNSTPAGSCVTSPSPAQGPVGAVCDLHLFSPRDVGPPGGWCHEEAIGGG